MRRKRKRPVPGPENTWYTNNYIQARERKIDFLVRLKRVNAARRAELNTPGPAPAPRLDATPVRLTKPQKMPHLRRACDEDEE